MSLRLKYFFLMAGAATLILGAMLAHHISVQSRLIENQYKGKADLMADLIMNGLVTVMVEGTGKDFVGFIRRLSAPDLAAVTLYSPDGNIISTSNPGLAGAALPAFYTVSRRKIQNANTCQLCHLIDGPVLAEIEVVVPNSAAMLQMQEMWERNFMMYISAIVALSLIAVAGYVALTARQIRAMQRVVAAARTGDLSQRTGLDEDDELSQIARGMDAALAEAERERDELVRSHSKGIEELRMMANLGELSSAIAHEIKNPLAGISGAIQVMAEDFGENDPRCGIVQDIIVEIERLDSAIRDLTIYAKPPELHMVHTTLANLIEMSSGRIRGSATNQSIDVNIEVDASCPVEVEVDPEQMGLALRNIMQRTMTRMPQGGTITLRAQAEGTGRRATLSIRDDGEPLDTSDPEQIFRPLFKGLQKGSGLGLAIARGIVLRHGFTISARGGERGAVFEINMPSRPMTAKGGDSKADA